MNRFEKTVAFVLGTLVFIGLFIFIYTSMKTPPSTTYDNAPFYGDEEDFIDFNELTETEPAGDVIPTPRDLPEKPAPKPVTKPEQKK